VLTQALGQAVRLGLIPANPAHGTLWSIYLELPLPWPSPPGCARESVALGDPTSLAISPWPTTAGACRPL
jgi:hypothetical protein